MNQFIVKIATRSKLYSCILGFLLLSLNCFAQRKYFVDPLHGNDSGKGDTKNHAWKSFAPVARLSLSAGDKLYIFPGAFQNSLALKGIGTVRSHVNVFFAPGRYDFFPAGALHKQLYITNTNDSPMEPKAIALLFDSCRFVDVYAKGAVIMMRGKMIETFLDQSQNVSFFGIAYNYIRPTVSELKVTSLSSHYADLLVHKDSKFSVKDSILTWEGENWRYSPGYYWQVLNPFTNEVLRLSIPEDSVRYADIGHNSIRAYFKNNPGYKIGYTYQNRDITRDCAGIFIRQCKNILLRNIHIYFMHGMGVVCQYSENIKLDHLQVKPQANSGRTCSAWADILHFAGCKGKIEVGHCYLSAANDDAINIHGIHLQIVEIRDPRKLVVRFMHDQTFGFPPVKTGDSIDFVRPQELVPYASGAVHSVHEIDEKEFLITLSLPAPGVMHVGDVIENTTATPQAFIHDDTIARIPTRGILVTTRRKVVIQNNILNRTHMTGILINDDAAYWYESGVVRDVTIKHNKLNYCGEPAIDIHPENIIYGSKPVHSNITIKNNLFYLSEKNVFSAKSTVNINFTNNNIGVLYPTQKIADLVSFDHCSGIVILGNRIFNVLVGSKRK